MYWLLLLGLLAAFSLELLAAAFAGFIGCFRWTVTDGVRCSEQTEIPETLFRQVFQDKAGTTPLLPAV